MKKFTTKRNGQFPGFAVLCIAAIFSLALLGCDIETEPDAGGQDGDLKITNGNDNNALTSAETGTPLFAVWDGYTLDDSHTWQWNKDGAAVAGAIDTGGSYSAYYPNEAGSWTVTLSYEGKSKTSAAVTVTGKPKIWYVLTYLNISTDKDNSSPGWIEFWRVSNHFRAFTEAEKTAIKELTTSSLTITPTTSTTGSRTLTVSDGYRSMNDYDANGFREERNSEIRFSVKVTRSATVSDDSRQESVLTLPDSSNGYVFMAHFYRENGDRVKW